MKKLAVIFPGIGYTADRSLLCFGRRLAEEHGFESRLLSYGSLPEKAKRDREKLREACEAAVMQAEEALGAVDFSAYGEILFVAKSIGTVAAARIAAKLPAGRRTRLLLYTPLEETFAVPFRDALVFTGSADPWVGGENSRIPALCAQRGIPCAVIDGANHSLETGDVLRDAGNLREILRRADAFLRGGAEDGSGAAECSGKREETIVDISQELFSCRVFPGDPAPERRLLSSLEEGAPCNLTALSLCAHNGTHVDAPLHFIRNGKSIAGLPLEIFAGPCRVFRHEGPVGADAAAAMLERAQECRRILIAGKATVTEAAAEVFAESGLRLLGNESQTVGPENAPGRVHRILLGAGCILLEGLVLSGVEEGEWKLHAAPLKLDGSDGAPCRAYLIR